MIPDLPPSEEPDLTSIKDKTIWKSQSDQKPLMVRWTSDFDCEKETDFWYVIKDDEYDISKLKAKRRYEITKARKSFEVRRINPSEFAEELYEIQIAAFSAYPEKYRPNVEHEVFIDGLGKWNGLCFGAFLKDAENEMTSVLCGYSYLTIQDRCINFSVQKTKPEYESQGVNAALVDGMLQHFGKQLSGGYYICDGSRSISHETAFQDYLEKYFGFRKSYCRLRIAWRPGLGWIIKLLYLFRKMLKQFDDIGIVHLANAVLTMEEIRRKCKEDK